MSDPILETIEVPHYLNTEQVALLLNTTPAVIRLSRHEGTLFGRPGPMYRKVGARKILYEAAEIKRWIEEAEAQRITGASRGMHER